MDAQFKQQVIGTLCTLWQQDHTHGIDSQNVYDALIAQGIPVPAGAMAAVFGELRRRSLIWGVEYGNADADVHAAFIVIGISPRLRRAP